MIKTFKFSINQKPDFVDEEINNWIKDNKVEIVGLEITSGTDRNGITFIYYALAYNK